MHEVRVQDMPSRVHPGQHLIAANGTMYDVQMERKPRIESRLAAGNGARIPSFSGSRELNGLAVLMAVINNWDLKDENNAIHRPRHSGPDKKDQ
jgi:hypothetical protein